MAEYVWVDADGETRSKSRVSLTHSLLSGLLCPGCLLLLRWRIGKFWPPGRTQRHYVAGSSSEAEQRIRSFRRRACLLANGTKIAARIPHFVGYCGSRSVSLDKAGIARLRRKQETTTMNSHTNTILADSP